MKYIYAFLVSFVMVFMVLYAFKVMSNQELQKTVEERIEAPEKFIENNEITSEKNNIETEAAINNETASIPKFKRSYNDRYETSKVTRIIVWTWEGKSPVRTSQLRQTIEAVHERMSIVPRDHKGYVDLLLETCAVESLRGLLVKQKRGPARGIFQMEPLTEKDTLTWLKSYFPDLYKEVMIFYDKSKSAEWNRTYNVPYTAAMSTVYYWRCCGDELAEAIGSRESRAVIWKTYYNTHLGKGTVEKYIEKSEKHL